MFNVHKFLSICNKPENVWDSVDALTGRKIIHNPLYDIHKNGRNLTGKEMANRINEFLVSIGECPEKSNETQVTSIKNGPSSSITLDPFGPHKMMG